MGRSGTLKKKGSASERKGTGSTFLSLPQKELLNEMRVTLNHVRPNLVSWHKDIMFSLQWMEEVNESQPTKIETTSEHLLGAAIPLDLRFSFSIESSLTPSYLTTIINNPIIINVYETTGQKSNTKGGNKSTAELLGQACLDILPLFMPSGKDAYHSETSSTEPKSREKSNTRHTTNSVEPSIEGKNVEHVKDAEKAEESSKSVEKIASSEFQTELTLEAKNISRGADLLTPMNKVNIGLTACLYLDTPLPEPGNIITIIPESVYNLPAPLSDPQFNMAALSFSLGLSIPVSGSDPSHSLLSLNATAASSGNHTDHETSSASRDQNVTTVTFLNGRPESQPDLTYRSKWKSLDDQLSGRAKYTTTRLSNHFDDVKHGESVSHGATNRIHIQFNQTYRLWLTSASESLVREHIASYGQWPLEMQIEAFRSAMVSESKKGGGAGKSQASHAGGGKSKPLPELQLPLQLLTFVDLTDLLLPGLTQSRVLAEFLPDPPSLSLLHMKTGFTRFVFPAPESTVRSLATVQQPSNSIRSPRSYVDKKEIGETKNDDTVTKEKFPDQFHADPFAIVVRIEFFQPLVKKPEQDSTVHDLLEVIRSKHLYLPDLSRMETERVKESFEQAIRRCTEIFYAEYGDYEKLRATLNKATRSSVRSDEKMSDTFENGEKKRIVESKGKKLSDRQRKVSDQKAKITIGETFGSGDQLLNQNKADEVKDAQTFTRKSSKADETNGSEHKESLIESPIKILIPDDFKKYISQSGALTKCYTILEKPLENYVRSKYGATEACSVRVLSEIHATLMAVMRKVVDSVACSSIQPASGGIDGAVDGCVASQGVIAKIRKENSTTAHSNSSTTRIAYEYSAQGFQCDAQRLLLSLIRNHPHDGMLRNSTADHSFDGTVWTSLAQWSLGQGDQIQQVEESLKQSLYLSVELNALLMMAYVSYRKKDWDKADLYFTTLSYLFDDNVIVWTALNVYHLMLGRTREAATALHMARVCLCNEIHQGGSEEENEKMEVKKVRPQENQTRSNERHHDTQTDNTHYTPYKPPVKTESESLATLLSNEFGWSIPRSGCFKDNTYDNSVYMRACPVFLALNMFDFADACIGEYVVSQSKPSALSNYYRAVSHYKQGQYHQSMSHLNNIPAPLNQWVPGLVLKFHNAYSLHSAANKRFGAPKRSMNSSATTADSSSSNPPSFDDCRRIFTSISKQLERPEYHSLRFLVLLRLGEMATTKAHAHLITNDDPKLIVSDRKLMDGDLSEQFTDQSKRSNGPRNPFAHLIKYSTDSSKQADDQSGRFVDSSKPSADQSQQFVVSSKESAESNRFVDSSKESNESNRFVDSSKESAENNRFVDSSKHSSDSELHMLNEAEQNLLLLAREYDSPLVWYYLGLIYLKQNQLIESEQAFNEANKLDPLLGNPWAGLALVNFALRRPSWFVSCRDQARKYNADPALIKILDKMAALMT